MVGLFISQNAPIVNGKDEIFTDFRCLPIRATPTIFPMKRSFGTRC